MIKKINTIIISILLIILASYLQAEDKVYKWNNVSGKWETGKDVNGTFLLERKAKCYRWEYSELINFNSIVTLNPLNECSLIKFTLEIIDPILSPVEIMLLFALKDYRTFYAFKFVIDNHKDNELQFISSKIKDPSLDKAVKKNFEITKLQKKKFSLEFCINYNIEIKINKNNAELFIDGKKEMEAQAAENLTAGKTGFSGRNTKVRIRDIKIYSGEKIVFEDDFSVDSIKRWTVKAKQVK